MIPRDDPNGWRRAYLEASSRAPERGPIDAVGRFFLAFLPSFAVGHTLATALLERIL